MPRIPPQLRGRMCSSVVPDRPQNRQLRLVGWDRVPTLPSMRSEVDGTASAASVEIARSNAVCDVLLSPRLVGGQHVHGDVGVRYVHRSAAWQLLVWVRLCARCVGLRVASGFVRGGLRVRSVVVEETPRRSLDRQSRLPRRRHRSRPCRRSRVFPPSWRSCSFETRWCWVGSHRGLRLNRSCQFANGQPGHPVCKLDAGISPAWSRCAAAPRRGAEQYPATSLARQQT